jgi:hypothetical protein
MITIACAACSHALSVTGEADEIETLVGSRSDFHPDKYKCYNCEAPADCVLTAEVSAAAFKNLTVYDVTPQEAFAALHGMGIPPEMTCCAEVIEGMFEKQGIKVTGYQMPRTSRYVLTALTFPDGSTVHLGASFPGALAYRITKKHSYVQAVETKHVD